MEVLLDVRVCDDSKTCLEGTSNSFVIMPWIFLFHFTSFIRPAVKEQVPEDDDNNAGCEDISNYNEIFKPSAALSKIAFFTQ